MQNSKFKITTQNSKLMIAILILLVAIVVWFIKPIRYEVIGLGYRFGILNCPTGVINRFPGISYDYDDDYDDMLKKNCKDIHFIY